MLLALLPLLPRPRVGTLYPCAFTAHPQAGALPLWFRRPAHRLQATAPLTRTTRRSSMPQPTAQTTIPRFVCALLAVIASPSAPTAGTPLRSLTAEHAAARSPTALEGPSTRATHRYQLLLCPGRTARTPLRIAARALLALRSVRHMLPPPFYSSNVSRPRAPSHNKHLVVFLFCFS